MCLIVGAGLCRNEREDETNEFSPATTYTHTLPALLLYHSHNTTLTHTLAERKELHIIFSLFDITVYEYRAISNRLQSSFAFQETAAYSFCSVH